jgi:hypothetical protein
MRAIFRQPDCLAALTPPLCLLLSFERRKVKINKVEEEKKRRKEEMNEEMRLC